MQKIKIEHPVTIDETDFAYALALAKEAGLVMSEKPAEQPLPVIFMVYEHMWESWVSDTYTFVCIAGLIGFGKALGSPTMEVVGAIIAFVMLFGRCVRKGIKKMTPDQVRAELDRMENT